MMGGWGGTGEVERDDWGVVGSKRGREMMGGGGGGRGGGRIGVGERER